MRIRWVLLLGAAVVMLALLAAACGGGDDDDAGDDGDAATATLDSGDSGDDTGDDETAEPTEETGDDDDDSSADAVDACSLITKDEAEAALGASVSDGEAQDFPPVYGCTYRTEDLVGLVAVSVVVFDDADEAEAVYELAIDNNDYPKIDGIGERAYFALGFGLTAQQDNYEVTVDIIGPDDDRQLEEDLARSALERLP